MSDARDARGPGGHGHAGGPDARGAPRSRIRPDRPDLGEPGVDEDVEAELRFHLEMRARELEAAGWTPEEAMAEARRRFGNVEEVRRTMTRITRRRDRKRHAARALDGLAGDLRYGVRTLVRSPVFALVGVLTLALGIGANSAIFSVVDGVLLRPLPYPDADRLVQVMERSERGGRMGVAWPNYRDWTEQARSLESLAAYASYPSTVLGFDRASQVRVATVSESFFDVLGVEPLRGRLMLPEEHRSGADPAAVVSHAYWQEELGGVPSLDGVRLSVGEFDLRVVGVMPPGFGFPGGVPRTFGSGRGADGTDLWFPAELDLWGEHSRTAHNYLTVGRLRPGTDLEAARSELDAVTARVVQDTEAGPYTAVGAEVDRLQAALTLGAARPLYLLLGAALMVLLVACANLASTFLARASNRERELAVRASLGAGRWRLVRQLFTEALVLTAAGAAVGLLVAAGVVRGLTALAPSAVPLMDQVRVDGRVVLFTLAVAGLTAVLFGLLPGLRAAGRDVGALLRGTGRGNARGDRRGVWRLLVAAEVALALVLLVGAGLLVRSFARVAAVEPGFEPRGVVAASVSLPEARYPGDGERVAYIEEALGTLGTLAGVEAAGLVSAVPLAEGAPNGRIQVDGGPEPTSDGVYLVADAGYFEAMEIPLLRGRLFERTDDAAAPHVAVVSESFAERAWPGLDPLGKRLTGGGMDNYADPDAPPGPEGRPAPIWATVVGVVGDVRQRSLTRETTPVFYFPYRQRAMRARSGALVVRSGLPAASLVPTLRERLRNLDPMVPARFRSMEAVVAESLADRRFTLLVLGAFAALALGLAALGIYGVVSYFVARRTREMGIRLALGDSPTGVRALVHRGAMGPVVVGAAVGIAAALALGRVMESLLFEVSPVDPLTIAGVAAVLGAVAWLAAWIPARRATRVDPMLTMRAE